MSRYGRLSTDEIDPDDAFGVDVPSDGPRSRPLLAVALLAVLSAATGALIAHFCWPPLSSHSMTGAASLNVAYPFESWMGDHWSSIASKPIWDLTLPGVCTSTLRAATPACSLVSPTLVALELASPRKSSVCRYAQLWQDARAVMGGGVRGRFAVRGLFGLCAGQRVGGAARG